MVIGTAAHKYEKIFNPVGDAETKYVLVKFGSSLYIVHCQGEMTQFLWDDANAAKVMPRGLNGGVQAELRCPRDRVVVAILVCQAERLFESPPVCPGCAIVH